MSSSNTISFSGVLERLLEGEELSLDYSTWLMESWLTNQIEPVQTGALLSAFRSKGITDLSLIKKAKENFQRINDAYEQILKIRGEK